MLTDSSDLQLVQRIQKAARGESDSDESAAVAELVNRHTGIYINVVKKYSCYPDFVARANVDDLKDEKFLNIYQFALKYDGSREMKFGSYVGKMTKHMCQNLITRGDESVQFNEYVAPSNETSMVEHTNHDSDIEEINLGAAKVDDPTFREIFKLRFGGQKPLSWRAIGEAVGMTHEGARKVFNRYIDQVREGVT